MRRAIAIAVAGASLGGCSSFSLDAFKPTPPTVQLQLESIPPGADAVTSLGPGCKTPCAVAVSPPRRRLLRHLHHEQVPAGDGAGGCHPQPQRLFRLRPSRSIPIPLSPNFSRRVRRPRPPGKRHPRPSPGRPRPPPRPRPHRRSRNRRRPSPGADGPQPRAIGL